MHLSFDSLAKTLHQYKSDLEKACITVHQISGAIAATESLLNSALQQHQEEQAKLNENKEGEPNGEVNNGAAQENP